MQADSRHIAFVDYFSSREPQHPTVVQTIYRDPDYSPERTDKRPSERYLVTLKGQIDTSPGVLILDFHEGCPPSAGLNGWLTEDLVAIVHHRMAKHQEGPFACEENGEVVRCLEEAMGHMLRRRQNRQARGVSATQKV